MAHRKALKKLRGGDGDIRRSAIISASRSKNTAYLAQLLDRLHKEPDRNNRRHIVVAIGNIGGEQAAAALLDLLRREDGIILGDLATALGRMHCAAAKTELEKLKTSKIQWVAQQAAYALNRIRQNSKRGFD